MKNHKERKLDYRSTTGRLSVDQICNYPHERDDVPLCPSRHGVHVIHAEVPYEIKERENMKGAQLLYSGILVWHIFFGAIVGHLGTGVADKVEVRPQVSWMFTAHASPLQIGAPRVVVVHVAAETAPLAPIDFGGWLGLVVAPVTCFVVSSGTLGLRRVVPEPIQEYHLRPKEAAWLAQGGSSILDRYAVCVCT